MSAGKPRKTLASTVPKPAERSAAEGQAATPLPESMLTGKASAAKPTPPVRAINDARTLQGCHNAGPWDD